MLRRLKTIKNTFQLFDFRVGRSDFYRELAKSVEKTEPLRDFVEAELKLARNPITRSRSKAYAMRHVLRLLTSGSNHSIRATIGEIMPTEDRLMLSAVDRSKDQPTTLRVLANAIDDQMEAKKAIAMAAVKPMLILPGAAALGYMISSKAIPAIEKTAPQEVWTPFNNAVRITANVINNHGLSICLITLVLVLFFLSRLPTWRGPLRLKMEKCNPTLAMWLTPVAPWLIPLSMYRDFQAGLVFSALAVWLGTGRNLKESLEAIHKDASPWLRLHIRRILNHLNARPTEYVEAFSKGLVSQKLLARLGSSIRNTPSFSDVIIEVGTKGNTEAREQVTKNAAVLNFTYIAIVVGLVMFLYLGLMNISNSMEQEMDPIRQIQREMEKKASKQPGNTLATQNQN
ncbi:MULTISPECIES: hypothetical protein [Janthinobacterium]|uniref:hypothetical protein n=1 Tax=Janthinobacterium TaxID=29580 RepID=UPI000874EF36|nr:MULTISPECIES: hypothetical protein [Janthinobacterium]MCC7696818.1 hypothetical protein [Janthinobacterium sp. EB271-G4-7A]MCC7712260.1 hypothetical protein [Janthinobacterium lividum]OEZ54924.1 toxin coregulated pilus biosynthesis protein E [Janthinobacterium lividum]WQE27064.1 hypothetical protein U0004_18895 [Janthinobacterium lividum]STQ97954.1 Bacterial type II secretion system protein F domain [Janthinobacterium lividum]